MNLPAEAAGLDFCSVTTLGRVSGRSHRIEIWFAASGSTLYLLSGGGEGADWVRNLRTRPSCTVELGDHTFTASARFLGDADDEDALARRLLVEKYQPGHGSDLSGWRARSLPVALDLSDVEG